MHCSSERSVLFLPYCNVLNSTLRQLKIFAISFFETGTILLTRRNILPPTDTFFWVGTSHKWKRNNRTGLGSLEYWITRKHITVQFNNVLFYYFISKTPFLLLHIHSKHLRHCINTYSCKRWLTSNEILKNVHFK